MSVMEEGVSVKLCECGCGVVTPIAARNSPGNVKGQHLRWLRGHHMLRRSGLQANQWKGGVTVDVFGYVRKLKAGSYVGEHVLKSERALGRPLPAGAIVHHANEVKPDNRNSNLVICQDRAYHMLLHKRIRAYKATGSATAIKCTHCGVWGMAGDPTMRTHRSGTQSMHRTCDAAAQKRRRAKRWE